MAKVRKFYLQNAAGDRIGLLGESGAYLTVPEGLGYELDPPWADLGRGFFQPLDETYEPQGGIAGELVFIPPAYANYRSFVNWLASAGSLLLIYCPFGDQEFQRVVSVEYLQKGELDKTKLLHCPVSFKALSPWRLPTPTEISMVSHSASGVRPSYPGRYSGRYGLDRDGTMAAKIPAIGHIPGSVLLRIRGAIVNPVIRLAGADSGTLFGLCRLTGASLGASDVLELSTAWDDSYIRKIAADGETTDLLPWLDISGEPFFHVPTTEATVLTVKSDGTFAGSAELLVYSYYRTV